MGTTKEKVASQSLLLLRADTITTFEDDTNEAEIVKETWDTFVENILVKHPWSFATRKIVLNRGSETPVNEWKYAYVVTGELLRIIAVYNSTAVGAKPVKGFELQQTTEGYRILTNEEKVVVEAIFKMDAGAWPPYFTDFAIYAYAANIATPVTDDEDMETKFQTKAYGTSSEGEKGGKFAVARNIDDQQRPAEEIQDNEIIAARFS